MNKGKLLDAVEVRYGKLAKESCSLSCGGAIRHSKVEPGDSCLDLGCGRGKDLLSLAEIAGPGGHVFGIDISGQMLKRAEKAINGAGLQNVSLIKSEFETIPLKDGSLNLIISNCAINHASNKQAVWNEVYRTLKVGGRFVVSDIYSLTPVPEHCRTNPEAVAECWAGSVTKEDYLAQLAGAGFKAIDVLEESKPYPKGEISVVSWTISAVKKAESPQV